LQYIEEKQGLKPSNFDFCIFERFNFQTVLVPNTSTYCTAPSNVSDNQKLTNSTTDPEKYLHCMQNDLSSLQKADEKDICEFDYTSLDQL